MTQKPKIDEVHYTVTGTGPAILLLAGLGLPSNIFDELIAQLNSEFTCVAVDVPGSGRSPLPHGDPTIASMAEVVARTVINSSISPGAVLGHSMGGFIAMQLAANHPELVERLVLLSSAAKGGHLGFPFATKGTAIDIVRNNLEVCTASGFSDNNRTLFDAISKRTVASLGPAKGFVGQRNAASLFDFTSSLGQINCPVLVMHGAQDAAIKADEAELMATKLPDSRFVLLENTGHMPQIECAPLTADHIRTFLAEP